MAESWAASAIVTLCAGLIGSAFVPIVIYFGQHRAARTQATADLLREFNAPDMSLARRHARELAMGLPGLSEAEEEYLYAIARFYHRLNAMREAGALQDDLLFAFFAQDFAYWWAHSIQGLHERSRTRKDNLALHGFFDRQATAKAKRPKWDAWLAKGERDRTTLLRSRTQA